MKYDFDVLTDRTCSNSLKWDVGDKELPMWVADMDFKTAPVIIESLLKRVLHGIFGYTVVPKAWYDAYIGWWKNRHGLLFSRENIMFCTGVVPAISSMVRKLSTPAEKALIQTPVYNIFFNSVINNGRQVIESPLRYENGVYFIDWTDLESKLSDPQTSLMILCNPHNPIGKIWDKDTLIKIGQLCKKYHVTVISDEIHCDITEPDKNYIPFASVNDVCKEISVTCVSPTKAFNIAGIQTAAVIAYDPVLYHKVWRALNTDEIAEPNVFAIEAAVAAFTEGGDWLDEMRRYISKNKSFATDFLKKELPMIHVVPSDSTYLMWMDCGKITKNANVLAENIRKKTGLYLSSGEQYGNAGRAFLRLNIACPLIRLKDGLSRLSNGIKDFCNQIGYNNGTICVDNFNNIHNDQRL